MYFLYSCFQFSSPICDLILKNFSPHFNSVIRESSFNMARRNEDIEGGGGPKIFRHPKGGL